MTPALATVAPAATRNLTPRDAAEWATSVAAVRACDDAALDGLLATLTALQARGSLLGPTRDLLTLTRSERAIRRVEAALATPLETP